MKLTSNLFNYLAKLVTKKKATVTNYSYLDKLAGRIGIKDRDKTNYSERKDYDYYQD
ncbi:hypothetical protein KKC08_05755 [Patescibacteria group bacterium]|nr:hypothetical protein [Patescibacteria group bacterium]MCG2702202.1 hypothetical protein [Candidatus Parcubacteria bacterium]MBU4264784.1 hypothetical protein [Patescibacteria group bacterium]MBU4390122.1 hypothetical protein [Patescibacteria group bacterium]MBU4397639.1 hypothetical protein [Patescibacteria group bacterium]